MNVFIFLIDFLLNFSYFFFLVKAHLIFLWNFYLWGSFGSTTTTLALTTASCCITTTISDIASSSRCCWDYRWLFWFSFHSDLTLLNSNRPLGWHLLGRIVGNR